MQEMEKLMQNYPQLKLTRETIEEAYEQMRLCYLAKGKLMFCGNGGSAADCEHIVGELMKEYRISRAIPREFAEQLKRYGAKDEMLQNIMGALPAVTLTSNTGFFTAFCNDNDAEYVFAQQVYGLGRENDILFVLTTSGNSPNIINASIMARAMGIKVIALTGSGGGKMKEYADILIDVPEKETARVQELHLPVYHALCGMLEEYFYG